MFTQFRISELEQGWLARLIEADPRNVLDLSIKEENFISRLLSLCTGGCYVEWQTINELSQPISLCLADVCGQA
jgi:hypothetical protein